MSNVTRAIEGFRVHAFDIAPGWVMGYYPECNPLIPLSHHAEASLVPAAKSISVQLHKSTAATST
jgi:hypothetical protein